MKVGLPSWAWFITLVGIASCGDDGVAVSATDTDATSSTGTGQADSTTMSTSSTGGMDESTTGSSTLDTDSTGPSTSGVDSSTSGGSEESGSTSGTGTTTGGVFVCEPIDLGSTMGEVAMGTTADAPDNLGIPCVKFDSADVHYQWTAPADGSYLIDTFGSSYDTALMVLAGDCDGAVLGCNDDMAQSQSAVAVDLQAGETILIVVDGWGGATGDYVLSIGDAIPGDCCVGSPVNGCEDPTCEAAVCAIDASCCTQGWSNKCATEIAPQVCDQCAPPGSCCFAHEDPSCDGAACADTVCALQPTCCTDTWTQECADLATANCPECAPGVGDCCKAHEEPGCNDLACEQLVCSVADPFCCDAFWDPFCADTAVELCAVCQDPGPCCFANFGLGCEDDAVESCVCATMPECCSEGWSEACAAAVTANQCGTCDPPDFSCVEIDLGSALGEVATGTNLGAGDNLQLSCTPPGGEEVVFEWTSPADGTYVFDTFGTDYDVGLGLRFPDCNGDDLACDAQFNQFAQTITEDVPAGVTVIIMLEGYGPTSGNYVLNINPPPGYGFCCLANGSPGCDVASCQTEVCDIDPTCCSQNWDDACAQLAQANCASCAPASLGDCCSAHGNGGCEDLDCAATVCAFDPWCCDEQWEKFCVDNANNFCGIC